MLGLQRLCYQTLNGMLGVDSLKNISRYFESLGQDVERFPENGGNQSGSAPGYV